MGRWSKAEENALELVEALIEHFEDCDLSDLEKLKNAYEICGYNCESSFAIRFLRRSDIENELEKNHKTPFWNDEYNVFWIEENSKIFKKEISKIENEILDRACEILSNRIKTLEKIKSEVD